MTDKALPAVPNRLLNLKTPPFPAAYPDCLVPNDKLQKALNKAIQMGPGPDWRVGLAIVSLEKPGAQPVGHFRGDREFFGASMIKVAALYGLFELRNTLRDIAKELGSNTSISELLADAANYLNPKIMANLSHLPALKGIGKKVAVPQFAEAFKPVALSPNLGFTVEFASAFAPEIAGPTKEPVGHIEKMIVVSNNTSAARCTHACGYGYLNGAIASAGFFEPGKGLGLWLAGDYLDTQEIAKYPYYRINSDNDGMVAQASSPLHLARLLTLLHDGVLFGKNAGANAEMLKVLAKAAVYPEVYIDRGSGVDFTVTHNKLGVADLKKENGGYDVESECSIVTHNASGRDFVVVWLNFIANDAEGFDPIAHVVRDTLNEYLKP